MNGSSADGDAVTPAMRVVVSIEDRLVSAGIDRDVSIDACAGVPAGTRFGTQDRVVWLTQLHARIPRKGYGRAGMAELCMLADEHDCHVVLKPFPQKDLHPSGLDERELVSFYSSLGFEDAGRGMMIRNPWVDTTVMVMRNLPYLPLPNRSEVVLSTETPRADLVTTSFVVPVDEDGSVVVSRSLKPGRDVEIAGGHVEPGETPEDAAGRESIEEIGVHVGDLAAIGHQKMTSEGQRPIDHPYPFPLSCQAFFAATIARMDPYLPNDECAPPCRIRETGILRPYERLLVRRAITTIARRRSATKA